MHVGLAVRGLVQANQCRSPVQHNACGSGEGWHCYAKTSPGGGDSTAFLSGGITPLAKCSPPLWKAPAPRHGAWGTGHIQPQQHEGPPARPFANNAHGHSGGTLRRGLPQGLQTVGRPVRLVVRWPCHVEHVRLRRPWARTSRGAVDPTQRNATAPVG